MEWKMQQLTWWPVFFIVVINKVKLLGYILSLVTLTRYTMYYHTHVANSDFYIAHYFV